MLNFVRSSFSIKNDQLFYAQSRPNSTVQQTKQTNNKKRSITNLTTFFEYIYVFVNYAMEYPTTIEHEIICYLNVEPVMFIGKK